MKLRFVLALMVVATMLAGSVALALRTQDVHAPLSAEAVLAHIKYLASGELQGRGTGTLGAEKAARYVTDAFRAAGLKPLGDRGGYLQHFEVTVGAKVGSRNSLAVSPPLWSAGLALRRDFLPMLMSGLGAANAELVFVGYGITAPDAKYDDYAGQDVKGKVALVLRDSPDSANAHSAFGRYASLRAKVMAARDRGAVAVLLTVGPLTTNVSDALGPWSIQQGVGDAGIPALYVTQSVAAGMLAGGGRDLKVVQQAIHDTKQPQSFAVPGVTVSLRASVIKERARTANVVGLLEGNDTARKEAVVIGAHYDHLGLGEQAGSLAKHAGGQIHYGADDNASGAAGLIELARHFAARRGELKRSLVFIAFAGEEMGLLGSKHFVEAPTWPLAKTVAMLNLDMVGRLKNNRLFVLGGGSSPFWQGALAEANRELALKFELSAGGSGFGASDHQSFFVKNIPVLHFFTGVHEDYHKPSDTWERVNAEGESQVLRLIARVAAQTLALETAPAFVKLEEPRQPSGASSDGFRVYLGTVPDYAAEVEGVRLEAVRDGSPAQKAGLQPGDVLVKFGTRTIRNVEEYSQLLREAEPGKPTAIVIIRNQQRVTLMITPGTR